MATLSPELISWLEQRDELTAPINGMRTMSGPASQPYARCPDGTTEAPDMIESAATLRMAEFSNEAAEWIFTQFEQNDSVRDLKDYATQHIKDIALIVDAYSREDDYAHAWMAMGMAEEGIQVCMNNSEWDMWRYSRSASEWLIITIGTIMEHVRNMSAVVERAKARIEEAEEREAAQNDLSRLLGGQPG